jgi:hypothetical protein
LPLLSASSLTTKRGNIIRTWVDKIIDYTNSEEQLSGKLIGWIREILPGIKNGP